MKEHRERDILVTNSQQTDIEPEMTIEVLLFARNEAS